MVIFQTGQILIHALYWLFVPGALIRRKYEAFRRLLELDKESLQLIAELEEIKYGRLSIDLTGLSSLIQTLTKKIYSEIEALNRLCPRGQTKLYRVHKHIESHLRKVLRQVLPGSQPPYCQALTISGEESLIGGKAFTLTRLPKSCQVLVPNGFVITTRAFAAFFEHNRLRPKIDNLLDKVDIKDSPGLDQVSFRIQDLIFKAEIPAGVIKEVGNALSRYCQPNTYLAFRSSAVGEDQVFTFAGQYRSVLNILAQDWQQAYKQVIASKYSPEAICYRLEKGLSDQATLMAVMVMEMVQSRISGILYTRIHPQRPLMDIFMVKGPGQSLVQGQDFDARITIDPKAHVVSHAEGPDLLSEQSLWRLAQTGQELEDYLKGPQEIEWTIGPSKELSLLQSRPLRMTGKPSRLSDLADHKPILQGQWVSSGRAVGRTWILTDPKEAASVPDGVILVVPSLPPELSMILDRVAGIAAEYGSPACHLASLAREAGLPVICQVKEALEIKGDQLISLDADQGSIYEGAVFQDTVQKPIQEQKTVLNPQVKDILEKALPLITPLSLSEGKSVPMSLEAINSLHDLVRYIHESGVQAMFSLVGRRGLNKYGVKRLVSDIPLVMFVLDVEDGLSKEAGTEKEVGPDQFVSKPMSAFWKGLSHPCVSWDPNTLHYDWQAYARSGIDFVNIENSTLFSSYAVLARNYCHALIKFGYHYVVVDGLIDRSAEANYLKMRFKGGGGLEEQRFFRLKVLDGLLRDFDFQTKITGDFIDASFDRYEAGPTEMRTEFLGIILGKTVLLDFHLRDLSDVQKCIKKMVGEIKACFPSLEN